MILWLPINTFIAAILSAVSGTGGGSLFIPLFSLVSADSHVSVPLSKTAILGTAIGANIVNAYTAVSKRQHDIDYKLSVLLQTGTIVGCIFGVALNLLLPSHVIGILMIAVLGFTAKKSIQYTMKQYACRNTTPLSSSNDETEAPSVEIPHLDRKEIILEVARLVTVWLINCGLLYLGGGAQSILCGGNLRRIFICADIVLLSSYSYYTYHRIKDRIILKRCEAIQYYFLSLGAGMFASLVGIGGGMIKGPMLLSMGLTPISAVATSNYMILFTAGTNVALYVLSGRLHLPDLVYTPIALLGGIFGVFLLREKFSAPQSQYVIAAMLTLIVIFGTVHITSSTIYNFIYPVSQVELSWHEACYAN